MFQCNVQILTWAFSNKSICRCKPLSSTATELLLLLPSASKTDVVGSANSKQQKKAFYSLSLSLSLLLSNVANLSSLHMTPTYVKQKQQNGWPTWNSLALNIALSHTHIRLVFLLSTIFSLTWLQYLLASLLSSLARRLAPPLTQSLILVYAVTLSLEL